jgi:hypothetical protein
LFSEAVSEVVLPAAVVLSLLPRLQHALTIPLQGKKSKGHKDYNHTLKKLLYLTTLYLPLHYQPLYNRAVCRLQVLVHNVYMYVRAETESRPHRLIPLFQYYYMLRYTCTSWHTERTRHITTILIYLPCHFSTVHRSDLCSCRSSLPGHGSGCTETHHCIHSRTRTVDDLYHVAVGKRILLISWYDWE